MTLGMAHMAGGDAVCGLVLSWLSRELCQDIFAL
jgi:hypothetical protein